MTAMSSGAWVRDSDRQRDPGDEGSRQALIEKTADEWVRRSWHRLDPITRASLSELGYAERGRKFDRPSEEAWGFVSFDVRQMIGLSLLVSQAAGDLRSDQWDMWPLMLDEEAIRLADTVAREPRLQTPELLHLALRLVLVTQAARAKSDGHIFGRLQGGTTMLGAFSTLVVRLGSMIALPAALGALPTFAAKGQLGWAVASAFALTLASGVLVDAVISDRKDKRPHYQRWLMVSWGPTSCTTGAGLRAHLEDMVRSGVTVPLIAFDLCHALQAEYDRRAQAAFDSAIGGSEIGRGRP